MASGSGCARAPAARSSPAAGPKAARASPRSPTDVRGVLRSGRSRAGERVILYVAPRVGRTDAAFVASRRVGGAVARNRARRIMRAAWRELESLVRGDLDVVFVARESIQGAKTQDLEGEMRDLLTRMKALRS